MYNYIDLNYFSENGLDDPIFLEDILHTSIQEFNATLDKMNYLMKSENFDPDTLYEVVHKFKPTAFIFKLKTYPFYEEFGTQNNKTNYEVFKNKFAELKEDLNGSLKELISEFKKFNGG